MNAYEFICENIDRTTKTHDGREDNYPTPLIPLPYPFTTPCAEGTFQEMYYWDTYFTHKCLLLTKREGQVRNNIKNFAYLLERYGKIPNGNRMHYLGRSQPPFFGLMLADLRKADSNAVPLSDAYAWLGKEYAFWENKRLAPNGLNRYGCDLSKEESIGKVGYYNEIHVDTYYDRTGIRLDRTEENGRCVIAECESGWDFSPRFSSRGIYYNPVDLNALLYADELLLAAWAKELGRADEWGRYETKAKERAEKMRSYMKKDGVYYDFDFVKNTRSAVVNCAAFFPYFVGLDDDADSFRKTLALLEREYGVAACLSAGETANYQWAEPNSWAPLNYIAVAAAERLGLKADAERLAGKYVKVTEKIFEKTERLWEKYNAETGALDVASEYGTPEMLGWTAGVYVAFRTYLENGCKELI